MTMPTSQTFYSNFLFIMLKFHKCAKRLNSNSRSSNNAFVFFSLYSQREQLIIVHNQTISLSFHCSQLVLSVVISKNEYEKKRTVGVLFFVSLSFSFRLFSLHTIQSTVHEVHCQESTYDFLLLLYK